MEPAIAEIFETAGCTGTLYAVSPADGRTVGVGADDLVVAASTIKVAIALEMLSQVADGTVDGESRMRLEPGDRTPGPVGISLCNDGVELSIRDMVVLMLTLSDNVCTDALTTVVGLDAVNARLRRIGLEHTFVFSDLHTMIDSLGRDAGFADFDDMTRWFASDPDPAEAHSRESRLRAAAALQPATATHTTARDMAQLLQAIWEDTAGPAPACAELRRIMAHQLTRHRIAAGFDPGVQVAAKSGGLMGVVRAEVGVVTLGDGTAYAIAVFTRTDEPGADRRALDAAIGEVARIAVEQLRS